MKDLIWKEDELYIKELICNLYYGNLRKFYYVIEKQRVIQLLKYLERDFPTNKSNLLERIDKQKSIKEVISLSQMGDKTLTNIIGDEKKTIDKVKEIVKEVIDYVENEVNETEISNKLELKIMGKSIEKSLVFQIILLLNSAYATISGSIRSKYGKLVEKYYLKMLIQAFESIIWHEDKDLDYNEEGHPVIDKTGLGAIHGAKWKVEQNQLSRVTTKGEAGREIDLLVFFFDVSKKRFFPLCAIEFTIGGRGNPSASVNKAKSIESFDFILPNSTIFTAFDLSKSNIRKDIKKAKIIIFQDDIETKPIEMIYSTINQRLLNLEINVKLIPINNVTKNLSSIIVGNCCE